MIAFAWAEGLQLPTVKMFGDLIWPSVHLASLQKSHIWLRKKVLMIAAFTWGFASQAST